MNEVLIVLPFLFMEKKLYEVHIKRQNITRISERVGAYLVSGAVTWLTVLLRDEKVGHLQTGNDGLKESLA